ncbi:MAG: hypothetical protein KDE33_05185 [Bacteroidetes bacterium]|nr:hypothetical protein [Bacteroidota bacterium]
MSIVSNKAKETTFQLAIGFFLLAAFLGALMRFIYLQEIPFLDYKYILHAHSHTAMLGWGFTALAGALVFSMLTKHRSMVPYRNALIVNTVAGLGMFITFLYQGYGALSIAFSTLHVFVAYYFSKHFLNDIKITPSSNAKIFAKWSVYLMLLSTLGLWSIAPVGMLLGKLHPLYFASIQFFLHFQFNGWFMYGILALLFKHSENNGHAIKLPKYTFPILQTSVALTYALSITWSTPENVLFYLNSVGVVLQLLAFAMLLRGFLKNGKFDIPKGSIVYWLLLTGILSILFKILMQSAVAITFIAQVSYTIRNFVIGFIHLIMLGGFSLTIIALLLRQQILPTTTMALNGYRFLIIAFVLTEVILFVQGILLWAEKGFLPLYYEVLFGITLLLPLSIILILTSSNSFKTETT